ncbi:hypothetical protein BGZ96_001261 [Linnemannia gamsii]|uniref:RNI-like protein n=1 Tax=Linnemannia gamsii TaxID=64522 RepID=A0ABQ7JML0_9FUNG|nr:hypothetical protein BGZ96_001261 [Linnemannia gamsii]
MTPHQRFRHGDITEKIAIRRDKSTGDLYSRVIDIQETFPDAKRFKVKGVVINFLEDENEQRFEPKRIAHYPDDIIEIISVAPAHTPLSTPANLFAKVQHQCGSVSHYKPEQPVVSNAIESAVWLLSLQPSLITTSNSLVRFPGPAKPYAASNPMLNQLVATLSSNASGISHLQQKVDQLGDTGSAQHLQLMREIMQIIKQQSELLQKQNEMLQEQAESKEREERMLMMQQETIDRLIVNQQRVDAILVQNYELHEYPIPRLFVIMPEPVSKWDPTTLLVKKYRLHFLCECGEHQENDLNQVATFNALPVRDIPVKNRVHLTNHPGYGLSRPNEFFERYGPFVLGMLRILKHCLAVATIVTPAVSLAENRVKEIMDGVRSISERTLQAVETSIGFLETRLNDDMLAEDFGQEGEIKEQEDNYLLQDLAALEGADLRRLETFLHNSDPDKVLGNLYRITTETGHVKWVCFGHYKETYRRTALDAFSKSVEVAGGIYDPHFRKVTISLISGTSAKDFFRRLAKQDSAIEILDVSLDWKFGASDLVMIVDKLGRSSVRTFNLDLKGLEAGHATIESLRPGKGRYHSLLGLLSNTKLRNLCFTNLSLLSTRTSDLPSGHRPSLLQSFHFLQEITPKECPRLKNILHHCPGLVDLHLGSPHGENRINFSLHSMICSLKNLNSLHLYEVDGIPDDRYRDLRLTSLETMKDLVYTAVHFTFVYLHPFLLQKLTSLEVLVFQEGFFTSEEIDLTPPSIQGSFAPLPLGDDVSLRMFDQVRFSKLTHLDLYGSFTARSRVYLESILPELSLVRFGAGNYTEDLLKYVNMRSLKSLSVNLQHKGDILALVDLLRHKEDVSQLDSLMLQCSSAIVVQLDDLKRFPLKRLSLVSIDWAKIEGVLRALNYSRLQVLSIYYGGYSWNTETLLAERSDEFRLDLTIELGYNKYQAGSEVFLANSRGVEGTKVRLARDRVVLRKTSAAVERLRFSLLTFPSAKFT